MMLSKFQKGLIFSTALRIFRKLYFRIFRIYLPNRVSNIRSPYDKCSYIAQRARNRFGEA